MNISFYVSGNAGRLRAILAEQRPEIIAATKLIFSDDKANADLAETAGQHGITYVCMHHEDIVKTETKSRNMLMSDEMLRLFREHSIDYCFSFGDHLLMGALLEQYENKIVNFHPSILPMFPGMMAIDQAVEAGSHLLGNTAHFIDQGIDTGPVIMQSVMPAQVFEQGGYDAVLNKQLPMLYQIYDWLAAGRIVVKDRKVTVQGAEYLQPSFFPEIEK